MEINRTTTTQAWKTALTYILEHGEDFKDHDNRICREVLNLTVKIEQPWTDIEDPIDRMRDFRWVYPSKEELSSIMLQKEANATYEFSYGPRIFNFMNAKDQLGSFIIPLLKSDPCTRRAVISVYSPVQDSNPSYKNIPSLMFIYFKIRDNRLDMTCFIRSNDFFIGWPGNIYQIFILQKYVAEKLGIEQGSITTISCSAHVFHEHFGEIEQI